MHLTRIGISDASMGPIPSELTGTGILLFGGGETWQWDNSSLGRRSRTQRRPHPHRLSQAAPLGHTMVAFSGQQSDGW